MRAFTFGDGRARVVVSDRGDGDRAYSGVADSLGVRSLVGVHQVHGARVVAAHDAQVLTLLPDDALLADDTLLADNKESTRQGTDALALGASEEKVSDASVAETVIAKPGRVEADAIFVPSGSCLGASMLTADCLPLVLATRDRGMCVVHAGWPGLVKGVVESALEALGGGQGVAAFVGPHIRPCCYEFVGESAQVVRARFGEDVFVGTSLDLDRVLVQILSRAGVTDVTADPRCTGCSQELFSYRTERSTARLVTAAVLGSVA